MNLIPKTLLALLLASAAVTATAKDKGPEPTDEESLQMAALEGLMAQPANRALPILKRVMAGPQSTLVKRRALFVLSQINEPEARDILLQTAKTNSELQGEAIRSIGISGDTKLLDSLVDVYKKADGDGKKRIMEAWMIAGRKAPIYEIASTSTSEEEVSQAIKMLGVMGAKEELRKLGDKPKQPRGLNDAYAISGDLDGLLKIAGGNGDAETKADAVSRIGIIGSDQARTALREIYTKSTDPKIKDAALHGLLIAGDDKGVLALYRAAKTTDEKRSLLRVLSTMNSDAAIEAIDATLEQKK
jgi:HEAT repeat protein